MSGKRGRSGGKREGAGRPPLPSHLRKKDYRVGLSEQEGEALIRFAGGKTVKEALLRIVRHIIVIPPVG